MMRGTVINRNKFSRKESSRPQQNKCDKQKDELQEHVLMRIPMRITCVWERDCGWLSGRGIRREGRLLEKDSEFETTRDWEREGNYGENV